MDSLGTVQDPKGLKSRPKAESRGEVVGRGYQAPFHQLGATGESSLPEMPLHQHSVSGACMRVVSLSVRACIHPECR